METLKEIGDVVIVYDPKWQGHRFTTYAAFLPDFFKKDSAEEGPKIFLVVFSRYGIELSLGELAGGIVHQLIGAGFQHLRGRLEVLTEMDLQCESGLYMLNAHQDFRLDKFSDRQVRVWRKPLEKHHCDDFNRFLRKHDPSLLKLWDDLYVDVPKLLGVFEIYVKFRLGEEVSREAFAEAAKVIRKDAVQGVAEAQFKLGAMYHNGQGVPQDQIEAAEWFRKAAEQGYTKAQNAIGAMYQKGLGVPKDHAEAIIWFRKAADEHDPDAYFNLGVTYQHGLGVPTDYAEAASWYQKAAAIGHVTSRFSLGVMYQKGLGVPQDDAEAVTWYRYAAEKGDSRAQQSLGLMYQKGQGVAKDRAEAARWYRKAAEKGMATSQYLLGWLYSQGLGVPRDDAEAVRWHLAAAEQGFAPSQKNLGALYAEGRGVAQDLAQAYMWYALAAEQGAKGAADSRDNVGGRMSPQQISKAKRLVAEKGNKGT